MDEIIVGSMYMCSVSHIEGSFEVKILDECNQSNYMVQVVRCTKKQFSILKQSNFTILVFKDNLIRLSTQ
jgi:hypothetical protein